MTIARIISFLMIAGMTMALCGCGVDKNATSRERSFPREQTLYLAGFVESPPASFNPLNDDPTYPMTGDVFLVYEPLFGYNMLSGAIEGILGTDFVFSKDTLTVRMNENAKWQDGTPVTSDDVQFTFELHRKYNTNLHSNNEYIASVSVCGPLTVRFVLNKDKFNPLIMQEILATTVILPKKAFKILEDRCIAEVKAEKKVAVPSAEDVYEKINVFKNDSQPLASGPYSLYAYSDQKVVLKRVDAYWGNIMHNGQPPPPAYIVFPVFKSNDAGNLALVQGDVDLSMNFIPQIYNRFKKGIGTWYKEKPYYIPGTIVCLLMELTKAPFSDVSFRRAVGFAVNYDQVRNLSIYGYAPALKPGLILPYGPEKKYYNEVDGAAYGVSYNPSKARDLLRQAGYTWGQDSLLIDPSGKKLPSFFATCPNGWSDWESTLHIVVAGLRDIGVDVREKFVEEAVWFKDNLNGNFDFTLYQPLDYESAATPWERFHKTMSSVDWAPPGQVMYTNTERYKDPVADSLLDVIPGLMNDSVIREAYRVLNVKFMRELPVVPLMYRPWNFYEFSTKHWSNFPTSDNPYSPPQWLCVGAGIKGLWGIKPKGK